MVHHIIACTTQFNVYFKMKENMPFFMNTEMLSWPSPCKININYNSVNIAILMVETSLCIKDIPLCFSSTRLYIPSKRRGHKVLLYCVCVSPDIKYIGF